VISREQIRWFLTQYEACRLGRLMFFYRSTYGVPADTIKKIAMESYKAWDITDELCDRILEHVRKLESGEEKIGKISKEDMKIIHEIGGNNMDKWNCSFCDKHEDTGMIHDTSIVPRVHYFFCSSCWAQWEGTQELTCVNLIKLKARIRKKGKAVEPSPDIPPSYESMNL